MNAKALISLEIDSDSKTEAIRWWHTNSVKWPQDISYGYGVKQITPIGHILRTKHEKENKL